MKINIGAGSKKFDEFVNCDYSDMYQPDYIFDIEKDIWPFPDNSVTHVIAHHVLEHLGDGYFHCLKELYRVCAPGALIDVVVPHHFSHNFFHDATHRRPITAYGLSMFGRKHNYWDFVNGVSTSRLGEYLNIDFEVIDYNYSPEHRYKDILAGKTVQEIEEYAFEKINVIDETHIRIIVIKGSKEEQIEAYYKHYLNRSVTPEELSAYAEFDTSPASMDIVRGQMRNLAQAENIENRWFI